MNKNQSKYLLIVIFLIVLACRLYFVFQTDNFSSDEAYFHIRHANYIQEHLIPMFYDGLSYGGREMLYPPLYHYIIALFVDNNILLKIIPEIILSLLIFFVYLIAREISGDELSSVIAVVIFSFIPLFIRQTLNTISIYGLTLMIILYMLYCLMKLNEGNNLIYFVILSFVLPLLSPTSLFFVVGLIFYLIFLYSEDIKIDALKREAILVSSFLILLINFIIYKKAFLVYGFEIIKQNVPLSIFSLYFKNYNLLDLIYETGTIPLILGAFAIYYGIYKEERDNVKLLVIFLLMDLLLLSLGLVNITFGLIFLGVLAGILSSLTIARMFKFLSLTKFTKIRVYIFLFGAFLIVISLIIPSYYIAGDTIKKTISNQEIKTLKSLNEVNGVVLGNVYEGNMISKISGKKNLMDDYFLMAPNVDGRMEDSGLIYTANSGAIASKLSQRHGIQYIFISGKTKELYDIEDLGYKEDESCFRRFGEGYKVLC